MKYKVDPTKILNASELKEATKTQDEKLQEAQREVELYVKTGESTLAIEKKDHEIALRKGIKEGLKLRQKSNSDQLLNAQELQQLFDQTYHDIKKLKRDMLMLELEEEVIERVEMQEKITHLSGVLIGVSMFNKS